MTDYATTSDLRQACLAAITGRAVAEPEARLRLTAELDQRDFAARSDHDLIELAYHLGVPADKVERIALLDAARRQDAEGRYLCRACHDMGVVRVSNDERSWFERCLECNPEEAE